MSFAYAISVPTLVASRVGTSLALAISVPMLLASCVGTGCAIARSMPTLGWPLSLTRGRVLTCVNYSCSHLSTPEGKFKKKIDTIHVTYVLPSALFYLVFTLC